MDQQSSDQDQPSSVVAMEPLTKSLLEGLSQDALQEKLLEMYANVKRLEEEKRHLEEKMRTMEESINDSQFLANSSADVEQQPDPGTQSNSESASDRARKISTVCFNDIVPGRPLFPSPFMQGLMAKRNSECLGVVSTSDGISPNSARRFRKRMSEENVHLPKSFHRGLVNRELDPRKSTSCDDVGIVVSTPQGSSLNLANSNSSINSYEHSRKTSDAFASSGSTGQKHFLGPEFHPDLPPGLLMKRRSEIVGIGVGRSSGSSTPISGIFSAKKRLSEGVINLSYALRRGSMQPKQDHTKLLFDEERIQRGADNTAFVDNEMPSHIVPTTEPADEEIIVEFESKEKPHKKKRKFKLNRLREDKSDLKKELNLDDHKISLDDLERRLQTNFELGLNDEEAEMRLQRDGPNALSPVKDDPEIVKFMKEMFSGFNCLLWIGAVLSFVVYGLNYLQDSAPDPSDIVVGVSEVVVVLITGGLGYHQQATSSKIMESFLNMVPQWAVVFRNGERKNVFAEELVVGDIVEIKFGDKVPADMRILASQSLKVDNSSLTGESEPQTRSADCTHDNPLETRNLVFYSTSVLEGYAKGVVINTGDRSVIGRIANLTSAMDNSETPISRELSRLVKIIVVIAVTMGAIFIIVIIADGYDPISAVIFLVGIIMGNVPEGLLATVTVILTLSAKRMAKKNCLVKKLQSVETLGSTSVICSDKTGTLTQNRMTVSHMWFDDEIFEANASDPSEGKMKDNSSPSWVALSRVAMLCNRAEFKAGQGDVAIMKRECNGDASETALLKCCEITVGNVTKYRKENRKVCEIPFNSVNKYQVSIHETVMEDGDVRHLLVMKGAPERIIDRCCSISVNGTDQPLTQEWIAAYQKAYDNLGRLGERVLGFADLVLPKENFPIGYAFDIDAENFPVTGFRFVGLMSMIDPPRPAVPDAVRKCRSAGIKVVMVTGDHPITAKAIAKAVGIITHGSETVDDIAERRNVPVDLINPLEATAAVIHGNDLRNMPEAELDEILSYYKEIVFARTSPQQKLLIVEGFQRLGNIVAVTGDGVNDSPALKKSDIGVAMGITGSDVSKQSADMILMDDNFASIVVGVEEGRLVFDNLKKTVCYTITHTLPELFPFILYLILNIPLATGTIALLFIDIITDIIPAVNLAYETPENDIMKRKPRDQNKECLVDSKLIGLTCGQNGVIESIAGMFVYCVILGSNGFLPDMLLGLRADWENSAINNLKDSYGQEWTYAQRKIIEYTSYTAYFVAVCEVQWFNLLVCKTRRNSVIEQGMYNHHLHVAVLIETVFIIAVSFIPHLDYAFEMATMDWRWFVAPLPFGLLLIVYNELRKLYCRYRPNGWVERELLA